MKTWAAMIYAGLREGYDGREHRAREATSACQEFCDRVGLCVTVTPTTFVYGSPGGPRGREPGVAVGLINYPRFPRAGEDLDLIAEILARVLMTRLGQQRVTVVGPTETLTLEAGDAKRKPAKSGAWRRRATCAVAGSPAEAAGLCEGCTSESDHHVSRGMVERDDETELQLEIIKRLSARGEDDDLGATLAKYDPPVVDDRRDDLTAAARAAVNKKSDSEG